MNIKNVMRIRTAKRTRLGRLLCRLIGDPAGGVTMEYVIIGTLVAAAAVLAVTVFGKAIVRGFNTMTQGTAGNVPAAEESAKAGRDEAKTGAEKAEGSRKTIAPGKD